jgi:hypothetical protein
VADAVEEGDDMNRVGDADVNESGVGDRGTEEDERTEVRVGGLICEECDGWVSQQEFREFSGVDCCRIEMDADKGGEGYIRQYGCQLWTGDRVAGERGGRTPEMQSVFEFAIEDDECTS